MTRKEDEKLEKLVNALAVEETARMLVLLADNFSAKTTVVKVPKGTRKWAVTRPKPKPTGYGYENNIVVIPLIPFFGFVLGYDKELDILVYWEPAPIGAEYYNAH